MVRRINSLIATYDILFLYEHTRTHPHTHVCEHPHPHTRTHVCEHTQTHARIDPARCERACVVVYYDIISLVMLFIIGARINNIIPGIPVLYIYIYNVNI